MALSKNMKKVRSQIRSNIICAKSYESYLDVPSVAAMEGLEDENLALQSAEASASVDLTNLVVDRVTEIIKDANIFFTQDGDKAYDEFLALLQEPKVRERLVKNLTSDVEDRNFKWFEEETPEEEELSDLSYTYQRAQARLQDMEYDADALRERMQLLRQEIKEKFPNFKFYGELED